MAKAGADAELQQFAKTFDDVKFRKGETGPHLCMRNIAIAAACTQDVPHTMQVYLHTLHRAAAVFLYQQ
jgi:hypothetical protein